MRAQYEDLFTASIELLLQEESICQYRFKDVWDYLNQEKNFNQVDSYLRKINRMVKASERGHSYSCFLLRVDMPSRRKSIQKQFKLTMDTLGPLVTFLKLASTAQRSNRPIEPGDTVKVSDLLNAIANVPTLEENLSKLTDTELFKTTTSDTKKQLNFIVERLVKLGYLIQIDTGGIQFQALGKWDELYEVLEFIADHEDLDISEEVQEEFKV